MNNERRRGEEKCTRERKIRRRRINLARLEDELRIIIIGLQHDQR
jgi:hypothetical protein